MNDPAHEMETLIAGYALGVLDAVETRAVESHLDECLECSRALETYQEVSEGLLNLSPSVPPPASLRSSLIRQIGRDSTKNAGWSWLTGWRPLRVITALALTTLVFLTLYLVGQLRAISEAQDQLTAQMSADRTALGLSVYPTAKLALVQGEGGYGTFLYEPQLEVAALYAWGLATLPKDQAYQVWLLSEDGAQKSAGLLPVEEQNRFTRFILTTPKPMVFYVEMIVTIEPSTGSQVPTGPIVLNVHLKDQVNGPSDALSEGSEPTPW